MNHAVTRLFPPMTEQEFQSLLADIREHGQREAIWTYRGETIDGLHRSRACEELGLPVRSQEWDGKGSLAAFVISLNLKRRHLTASQKAMIAQDALPFFEQEAKVRQRRVAESVKAKMPEQPERRQARDDAAAAVGVSPRYVQDAKRVAREAPELAEQVRRGTTSLAGAITKAAQKTGRAATKPEPLSVTPESRPWFADAAGRLREWLRDFNIPEFRDERRQIKSIITSLDRRQNSAA